MRVSTPSQTRRGAVPPYSRISLSYFLAGIKADARPLSWTEGPDNNYLFDALRYARYPEEILFRAPSLSSSSLLLSLAPSLPPRANRSIGFGITNRREIDRGTQIELHLLISSSLSLGLSGTTSQLNLAVNDRRTITARVLFTFLMTSRLNFFFYECLQLGYNYRCSGE